MNRERQVQAVENYVQAMRTGEGSAARQAGRFLADGVVLVVGEEEAVGIADVQARITGQWRPYIVIAARAPRSFFTDAARSPRTTRRRTALSKSRRRWSRTTIRSDSGRR